MNRELHLHAAVFAIFIRQNEKNEGEVFLIRRYNTGFCDGMYSLPAGHMEAGELPTDAMIREVEEEAGVVLQSQQMQLAALIHKPYRYDLGEMSVSYLFLIEEFDTDPHNAEPERCDHADWFPLSNLPETLQPFIRPVLEEAIKNRQFMVLEGEGEESITPTYRNMNVL